MGVASAKGVRAIPLALTGTRREIREQTVKAALEAIIEEIGTKENEAP